MMPTTSNCDRAKKFRAWRLGTSGLWNRKGRVKGTSRPVAGYAHQGIGPEPPSDCAMTG